MTELLSKAELKALLIDIDFTEFDVCSNAYGILYSRANRAGIDIDYGASKCVLFDTDKVYKLPFNSDEYGSSLYNYCDLEYNNYEKAMGEGLAYFFVPTRPIEVLDSIPVYIQTRVELYSDELNSRHVDLDSWYNSWDGLYTREKAVEFGWDDLCSLPDYWICDAIAEYGLSAVDQLINFLYENDINDCTRQNIGYLDHKPVIFDYAGYYE